MRGHLPGVGRWCQQGQWSWLKEDMTVPATAGSQAITPGRGWGGSGRDRAFPVSSPFSRERTRQLSACYADWLASCQGTSAHTAQLPAVPLPPESPLLCCPPMAPNTSRVGSLLFQVSGLVWGQRQARDTHPLQPWGLRVGASGCDSGVSDSGHVEWGSHGPGLEPKPRRDPWAPDAASTAGNPGWDLGGALRARRLRLAKDSGPGTDEAVRSGRSHLRTGRGRHCPPQPEAGPSPVLVHRQESSWGVVAPEASGPVGSRLSWSTGRWAVPPTALSCPLQLSLPACLLPQRLGIGWDLGLAHL